MKADELISNWKMYDKKLDATLMLQEKIVHTIIKERVSNRFSGLKSKYIAGITWMLICLLFSIAVLLTNPFDYKSSLQYVPMGVLAFCLAILTGKLVHTFQRIQNISIDHHSVEEALRRAIALYEKPKQFFQYTLITMIVSQTVLFPLSFLPNKLQRMSAGEAVIDTIIPMMISAAMLFIAHKAGAFKDRDEEIFRNDLKELNDFRSTIPQP